MGWVLLGGAGAEVSPLSVPVSVPGSVPGSIPGSIPGSLPAPTPAPHHDAAARKAERCGLCRERDHLCRPQLFPRATSD